MLSVGPAPLSGTTDAEIKVPSAENPELSKIVGLSQKIASRAWLAAGNSALLIPAFPCQVIFQHTQKQTGVVSVIL